MPRNGLGMPISASQSQAAPVVIDDVLWEDFGGSGGEIAVNYQETRTNIVLRSQDTTNAEAWTKTNTAIDSTLYEAPDGSDTANAIKSDSTGEKTYNIIQSNLSVTAGKTYTASVHLKKDALGFAKLRFNDGTAYFAATFNLTTGAATNTGNLIGTANKTSVDIMDNGWFRCSMTFQAQNTTSSGVLRVSPQVDASTANPNIAVSGIVLIYVWGFQLEESIEATSYIVTTTEARTATTSLNDTSDVWDFDSADLMPEADPDSEGVWETLSNVVTNGAFDADSNWSKGTGWTISGGKATYDGSGGTQPITQTIANIQLETLCKLTFDVLSNQGSGANTIFLGGTVVNGSHLNVGSYTFYGSFTSNTNLYIYGRSGEVFQIDNVSISEYAIIPQDV